MIPTYWLEVLEFAFRTTLMAAAVGGVLWVTRMRASATRHAVWTAVLVAMLTMPLAMRTAPAIPVPWPTLPAAEVDPSRQPVALPRTTPLVGTSELVSTLPAAPADAATRIARPLASPAPAASARPWPWAPTLLTLWAMVSVVMLGRLVVGWRAARRLVAESRPVDDLGLVRESGAVSVPVTVGMLRPAILLPPRWRIWTADKLEAVLAHERAHVARHDVLVLLLAHINRAVFWFHPLAWWLERRLAATAEDAADDVAAARVGEPGRYAELLLEIAAAAVQGARPRAAWHGVGMDGASRLSERVDRLLQGEGSGPVSRVRKIVVACGCVLSVVVAIACERQRREVTPLREHPADLERRESAAASQARLALQREVQSLVAAPEAIAALQDTWDRSPGDLATAEKLLSTYRGPAAAPTRRRVALWLIEHQPSSSLNRLANIVPGGNMPDPAGHDAAGRLWTSQLAREDLSPQALGNAAAFFAPFDPFKAEDALVRAERRDPGGQSKPTGTWVSGQSWTAQLGDLYGSWIAEGIRTKAESPFAAAARRTLETTTQPAVLVAAAVRLGRPRAFEMTSIPQDRRVFTLTSAALTEGVTLARTYLTRALELDPANIQAANWFAEQDREARFVRLNALVPDGRATAAEQLAPLTGLPKEEQIPLLLELANRAYRNAEGLDHAARRPVAEPGRGQAVGTKMVASAGRFQGALTASELAARAQTAFDVCRAAAERVLEIADGRGTARERLSIYEAHVVLGLLRLREGDGRGALARLRDAASTAAT